MNASINETGTVKRKKDKVFIMSLAACALSVLGILSKRFYASVEILPYDPSMLFLLSFISGSMLLASALSTLASKNKYFLFFMSACLSAIAVGGVHLLLSASAAETLLALAFVPSAVVLASCMKNGCEKTHTVVANAVVLSLVSIFSLLLALYETFGEISERSIGVIKGYLEEGFTAIYSSYEYTGISLSSTQISEMFDLAVVMLPAAL